MFHVKHQQNGMMMMTTEQTKLLITEIRRAFASDDHEMGDNLLRLIKIDELCEATSHEPRVAFMATSR